jgi:dihydroorotase
MHTHRPVSVLLRRVRLVRPDGTTPPQDLLIRDGRIAAIGTDLAAPEGLEIREFGANAHVSAGWFDLGVQAGDPGYEHREDLHSAAEAAQAGGFTGVATFPNTAPAVHSKSEVLYVLNKTAHAPVRFFPIGAVSVDCAGKDLAELYDMHHAGAVAFGDGERSLQDAGLLLRALQYASAFNGLIINHPHHKTIASGGQMHEGVVSTSLGLKGLPALAEDLMVQRDLSLLEYATGGRLHLHALSTARSVALVRAAKAAGLAVTASVAIANLCFTDEVLAMRDDQAGFDSDWKMLPPLRSEADRLALIEGLLDGTIDCICSNHVPCDEETKNLEFTYADFGMSGLETAFALARTHLSARVGLDFWVEKMALAPRRILGLPLPTLAVGEVADLTVFDPDATWVFDKKMLRSKSANSPLGGHALRGRVLGTLV